MSYDKGTLVRISARFVDEFTSGAVDPDSVTFKALSPTGAVVTYAYGTDGELIHDGTGHFHVDLDASETGVWTFRFESTGSYQGAVEDSLVVGGSAF